MFPSTLLPYFGRHESASLAVGSVKMRQAEENDLVSAALRELERTVQRPVDPAFRGGIFCGVKP